MYIVVETRGILTLDVFETLARRVKVNILNRKSELPEIICAASLAHHGLLGSVAWMRLGDVDLTSVPTEPLASLASSVTGRVLIENVSGCDLVTILASAKCERLSIRRQHLGKEETQRQWS